MRDHPHATPANLPLVLVPDGETLRSPSIENYLGFPKGQTGSDLAQRAIAQVSRFGAEMVLARDAEGFEARGHQG